MFRIDVCVGVRHRGNKSPVFKRFVKCLQTGPPLMLETNHNSEFAAADEACTNHIRWYSLSTPVISGPVSGWGLIPYKPITGETCFAICQDVVDTKGDTPAWFDIRTRRQPGGPSSLKRNVCY